MGSRATRVLMLVSAVVVAAFLGTTAYTLHLTSAFRGDARMLRENAIPSVKALVKTRSALSRTFGALDGVTDDLTSERVSVARHQVDRMLDDYLALPFVEGELQLYQEARHALDDFDARFDLARGRGGVTLTDRRVLGEKLLEVDTALGRLVLFNLDEANGVGVHIGAVWRNVLLIEITLSLICVLFTIAVTRSAAGVVRRHEDMLAERASELETFSGRMAHDVLSPLSSLSLAMPVLSASCGHDPAARRLAERAASSLKQVRILVDGLLEFARAGARPAPGAITNVTEILRNVAEELGSQAQAADVQLVIQGLTEKCEVACAPGVLASILTNLLRNAVKFTRGAPRRMVRLIVTCTRGVVRFDIEDTGPGLPPGTEQAIFDPYVRLDVRQPGIGVGLATVKRLVESHGGAVGAIPSRGRGAHFWFELPRARQPLLHGEPLPAN